MEIERTSPYQAFHLIYEPRDVRCWHIVPVGGGTVLEAYESEAVARAALRVKNALALPVAVMVPVRNVHTRQRAGFIGIDAATNLACVWLPLNRIVEKWPLSCIEVRQEGKE